jgi:hypothetical protein
MRQGFKPLAADAFIVQVFYFTTSNLPILRRQHISWIADYKLETYYVSQMSANRQKSK